MINFDILKSHSDPDFVARTYSEYLQNRANDYIDLINIVSEATVTNADQLLDQADESFTNTMAEISEAITEICNIQGINLEELDSTSTEYQTAVMTAVNDSSLDAIFESKFNDVEHIRQHYLEYTLPSADVTTSVDIPDYSSLTEVTRDDLRTRYKQYANVCNTIAGAICTEHDIPEDMPITLEAGYTNIKSLLASVVANANSLEGENSSLNLQLYSTEGVLNCSKNSLANYSIQSLSDELKRTLASAVSYAGGFLASTKETVSDRLQVFESYVSGKFKDITDYASTQVTAIKDTLSNAKNTCVDFFNNFLTMTGWKEEEGSITVPESVDRSDMANYTGASLVGALDWSNALKLGTSVAKTVAVTTAGIAVGAFNLVKGFFSKIGSWFVRNVVEGSDLKDLGNGSNSGLIDGFQYQGKGDASSSTRDLDLTDTTKLTLSFKNGTNASRAKAILLKKVNHWVSFSFLYGMAIIKPLSVYQVSSTGIDPNGSYLVVNFDWVFKPISLDSDVLSNAVSLTSELYPTIVTSGQGVHSDDKHIVLNPNNPDGIATLGETIQNLGDIKVSDKELDAPRVKGYALSAVMVHALSSSILGSIYNQIDSDRWNTGYSKVPSVTTGYITCAYNKANTAGASNIDFIKAASGYYSSGQMIRWDSIPIDHVGHDYYDDTEAYINLSLHGLFYALCTCWIDQVYDPQHYGYLAYSNNETSFPEPQYQVLTDAENLSIINSAITTGIIVAVVAILAIVTFVKFTNWRKKRFMRMTAAVGRMDNAMWQGDGLTNKECKKYIRLQRKLNKSTMLTKGLCGSDSSDSSLLSKIEGVASRVDTIYCQATGKAASALTQFLPSSNSTNDNSFDRIISNVDDNTDSIKSLIKSE